MGPAVMTTSPRGEYSPPPPSLSQGRAPCHILRGSAHAGSVHAPKLLLELGDLVAQPRGQLELQLRRGRVHLVVELLDEVREVGRGISASPRGVATDLAPPAAGPGTRPCPGSGSGRTAEQGLGVGVLAGDAGR